MQILTTSKWKSTHIGSVIGLLELSGIDNTVTSTEIDSRKREVESLLRSKFNGFSRADFLALPIMADYERYYKSFEKTYHVQLQLESIVLKGKSLPNVSPLVDSNFVSEIDTLILTAGHDVAKLKEPVTIDISSEGDVITQMNGTNRSMRAGDMMMRDGEGISCSIIYGQDNRSPISKETTHALYVAYAPPGVGSEAVKKQLDGILSNIKLFAPNCVVIQKQLIVAEG
jgi:DNA/RNA-binding domain of Phe-tRNA-synthetase-like protein